MNQNKCRFKKHILYEFFFYSEKVKEEETIENKRETKLVAYKLYKKLMA